MASLATGDQRRHIPWFLFIFLAVIFYFVEQESLLLLKNGMAGSAALFGRLTEEGSVTRRVAYLGLGLVGGVGLIKIPKRRFQIYDTLGWLILLCLVWIAMSLLWAQEPSLTLRRLAALAMLVLGALVVSQFFSIHDFVIFVAFTSGLYLLLGLFFEISSGSFHPFQPGYRFAGSFHPNHQGLNSSLLLMALVFLIKDSKRQVLYWAMVVVAILLLILTKSRTPFISVLIVLLVYWGLESAPSHKLAVLITIICTVCLFLLMFGEPLFSAFEKAVLLGREEHLTHTLSGRIPLWKWCLKYIEKRPFLGYGFGGFWTPRHIHEISSAQSWPAQSAHSAYIEMALNCGLVGAMSFILMLLSGLKKSFQLYRTGKEIDHAFPLTFLLFGVIHGITESAFIQLGFLTFLSSVILIRLAFTNPQNLQNNVHKNG